MAKRLAYLLFFLLLLYAAPVSWSTRLRSRTASLFAPLGTFLTRENARAVSAYHNFRQIGTLRQDKTDLQKEVISLQQQVSTLESAQRENETLRKELAVTGVTRATQKLLAHVIIRSNDPLDQTATLDVGSQSGVTEDEPAVSQGVLVGKIVSVSATTSTIRFITSSQSRIQVRLVDSQEKGLLLGDGNTLHLTSIKQGISVPEHAAIETSGLSDLEKGTGAIPAGILVGEVSQVESKKSDLSQSFFANSSQDIPTLESVFILLTVTR